MKFNISQYPIEVKSSYIGKGNASGSIVAVLRDSFSNYVLVVQRRGAQSCFLAGYGYWARLGLFKFIRELRDHEYSLSAVQPAQLVPALGFIFSAGEFVNRVAAPGVIGKKIANATAVDVLGMPNSNAKVVVIEYKDVTSPRRVFYIANFDDWSRGSVKVIRRLAENEAKPGHAKPVSNDVVLKPGTGRSGGTTATTKTPAHSAVDVKNFGTNIIQTTGDVLLDNMIKTLQSRGKSPDQLAKKLAELL